MKGPSLLSRLLLAAGFCFLYAPMLLLVVYSFNESKLVTVWSGFSFKWYAELFRDQQMMGALWTSLRIATGAATGAVLLGTLAALVLTRLQAFPGRQLFAAMITAPLVMPEVITGLSLLLLFVSLEAALGWPQGRSMLTIMIAHTTICGAYVAVVVASRLRDTDRRLEEAAMDLGASRPRVFIDITLPIIAPALAAGWLLAFTLSLDDVVVASFVSGPSSTTLPMVVLSSVRLGLSPKINALATLLIGTVLLGGLLAWWLLRREARRNAP